MSLTAANKSSLLKFATTQSIEHHTGFKNFSQNINAPDAIVLDIKDSVTLQNVVRHVYELNKATPSEKIVMRVAAGGRTESCAMKEYSQSFSMTPCMEGNIIL